jgi:predicted Fe-Mo cluster-binding NifX family protein
MKVLVTTTGKTYDSQVDPRFGRAELFAIVDIDEKKLEVVSNADARDVSQGAGIKAAELAVSLGVKAVITGHCGPKAFAALGGAGIEVVTGARGTVAQAVEAYTAGRLKPSAAPDVGGHWK